MRNIWILGLMAILACSSSAGTTGTTGAGDAAADVLRPRPSEASLTCEPPATVPFTPPDVAPPASWDSTRCTTTELNELLDACLLGSLGSTPYTSLVCANWRTAHPTCAACVFTPVSAAEHGPIVVLPDNYFGLNQLGCLEHFKTNCGKQAGIFASCIDAACDLKGNCEGVADDELGICINASIGEGGGCASTYPNYLNACAGVLGPGKPGNICNPGNQEDDTVWILRLMGLFCGGLPIPDGGLDGASD